MPLANEILKRFPQLARWQFQSDQADDATLVPIWLGLLLAPEAAEEGPICFVLPRVGAVARVAAVLHGMIRFGARFEELASAHAAQMVQIGERVRVNPSGHVFIYRGQSPDNPRFHRLQYLNDTCCRTIAASELLRLERTSLSRPQGKAGSNLDAISTAPLDQLLGTKTWGNRSLCRNEVLLLDSRSGFLEFAKQSRLVPLGGDVNNFPPVSDLIPVGKLSADGFESGEWFNDDAAEPLVAVTRSAQTLAEACQSFPLRSRLVVGNGLSLLRQRYQEFDDICSSQRVILVASHDEEDTLAELALRGCRVWRLSSPELALSAAPKTGLFHQVSLWTENYKQLALNQVACADEALTKACVKLQNVDSTLEPEPDGPLARLLGEVWGLLTTFSSVLSPPADEETQRLQERLASLEANIYSQRVWLGENADRLLAIHHDLKGRMSPDACLGSTKSDQLYVLLLQARQRGEKLNLLARNDNHAKLLLSWVCRKRGDLPGHPMQPALIYTPRTLPDNAVFSELVCVAWHGADFFRKIAARLTTPRITVLAYPFEQGWLAQCQRRLRQHPRLSELTSDEKARCFAGARAKLEWPTETVLPAKTPIVSQVSFDIFTSESRRCHLRKDTATTVLEHDAVACRYISFVGDSYAYLTQTHRLAVATELVSVSRSGSPQRLVERLPEELQPGDYVIFPKSGDHDLLTRIADRRLTGNAIDVRALAGLWRIALKYPARSKADAMALITGRPKLVGNEVSNEPWELDPVRFQMIADLLGHRISVAVARDWFNSDERLGPGRGTEGLRRSLEVIAKVTAHAELNGKLDQVFNAVCELRAAHQSAGFELRKALLKSLPAELGRVEEQGSLVDLGELGSAWVVQVESLADTLEKRSPAEVNCLLRTFNLQSI